MPLAALAVGSLAPIAYTYTHEDSVVYLVGAFKHGRRTGSTGNRSLSFDTRAAAGGARPAGGWRGSGAGRRETGAGGSYFCVGHRHKFSCRDGGRILAALRRSRCLGGALLRARPLPAPAAQG